MRVTVASFREPVRRLGWQNKRYYVRILNPIHRFMTAPRISVIMPMHNSAGYLEESVESVRGQILEDWELLLVDDASTDSTPVLARRYQELDARIRLFQHSENLGPARARNTAIEHARGRYLAFLDSDDLWRPRKLDRQMALLQCSQAPLAYTAYEKVQANGETTGREVRVPPRINYSGLLRSTVIATSTAMVDRQRTSVERMPDVRKRQDFAFWLAILKSGQWAVGIEDPLTCLRKRPGSVSSNKLSAVHYTWRVYRQCEQLSIAQSLYFLGHYGLRAFRKSLV